VVLTVVFSVWANDANADYKDGNTLYSDCTSTRIGAQGVCLGYVMAIIDVFDRLGVIDCVPRTATGNQVMDVAKKYLADHPEKRHFSAWSLVRDALRDAFPCK